MRGNMITIDLNTELNVKTIIYPDNQPHIILEDIKEFTLCEVRNNLRS